MFSVWEVVIKDNLLESLYLPFATRMSLNSLSASSGLEISVLQVSVFTMAVLCRSVDSYK